MFNGWDTFFIMTGTAAATLTGLLFVVGNASLIAGAAIAGNSFAPYAIAGAITLLLFVGIHDAWDLTLWIIRNQDIK